MIAKTNLCYFFVVIFVDKQVHVQPPPSAVKVTLPVFAAGRRRLLHGARSCRSIFLAAGRSAANAVAAVDRWDRQTDRRTLER